MKITIDIILEHLKSNQLPFAPTQTKLCIPIINRIYQKMMNDIRFDDIQVCENLIINGHHRYIAADLAGKNIGNVPTHRTSSTKEYKWTQTEFTDEEWDTTDKINSMNEKDAQFNNCSLAEIVKMIN